MANGGRKRVLSRRDCVKEGRLMGEGGGMSSTEVSSQGTWTGLRGHGDSKSTQG